MKKLITFVLLLAIVITNINTYIFAEEDKAFEDALTLNTLGLFSGVSGTSFELERSPTRVESLVMLLRLMGLEDKAVMTKAYDTGFDDIPTWADRYVSYAYDKGLAKGVSKNRFGSKDNSNARTYLTFVLRALGYSDGEGKDFTYNDPFTLARKVGITNLTKEPNKFTRGDMVRISKASLSAKLKNTDKSLISKLYDDEVINFNKVFATDYIDEVFNGKDLPLNIVEVSDVNEFVNNLKSNTIVKLKAKTYNLTDIDLNKLDNDNIILDSVFSVDSENEYEVVVQNVDNLYIIGEGESKTNILTTPRYANVLKFKNCSDIAVTDITLGHTEAEGSCTGGVLNFDMSNNIYLDSLELYGCGTYGIEASETVRVLVKDTEIRDCTYGAIGLYNSCQDFKFINCVIHDCKEYSIIGIENSYSVLFVKTKISDNIGDKLVYAYNSENISFNNCEIKDNDTKESVFYIDNSRDLTTTNSNIGGNRGEQVRIIGNSKNIEINKEKY